MCLFKRDRLEKCASHPKPYVYRFKDGWIVRGKGSFMDARPTFRYSWEEAYAVAISYAEEERV